MKGIKEIIGLFVILCCVVILQVNVAVATTFTFQPTDPSGNPTDMMDLDHYYVYSWLIDTNNNLAGEEIISAVRYSPLSRQ